MTFESRKRRLQRDRDDMRLLCLAGAVALLGTAGWWTGYLGSFLAAISAR